MDFTRDFSLRLVKLPLAEKVLDKSGKACARWILYETFLYGWLSCHWQRRFSIKQTKSVLDGELAVPCNPESAIPGLNSHPRA
jgi:hypothetical protein